MGKRSGFERLDRDYYKTPLEAVRPLMGHVTGGTFIEPCAGDGALVRHLSYLDCILQFDIEPDDSSVLQRDALEVASFEGLRPDYVITNPPWNRKLLHPMIDVFTSVAPTWLLFDADWAHTKQAAPIISQYGLKKIVSIGRVKWFPESKMTGKDNCAWYLFDRNQIGPPRFYGRL